MIAKPLVQAPVAVVLLVFAIGVLTSGGSVDGSWLNIYSYAVTAAILILWLWDRWLWRTGLAQKFDAIPHDLRGTWKGTLASQWVDPNTGNQVPEKPAYLVVRQTWSTVSATLLTDESESRSALAKVRTGDGSAGLDYMYFNEPKSSVEHRSRMHHGSTVLSISGRPACRLHGRYWADRDSRGELDFKEHSASRADDYESAEKLFG
jgi:hypothetical protein